MQECRLCRHWRDQEYQDECPKGCIVEGHIGLCGAPRDIDDAAATDTHEMFLYDFDGMSAALYTTHDFCCNKFESA